MSFGCTAEKAGRTSSTPNTEKLREARNLTDQKTQTVSAKSLSATPDPHHQTHTLHNRHTAPVQTAETPARQRPSLERGGLFGARSIKDDAALINDQRRDSMMSASSIKTKPVEIQEAPSHLVTTAKSTPLLKQVSELSLQSLLNFAEASSSREQVSSGAKLRYSPAVKDAAMETATQISKKEAELDTTLTKLKRLENSYYLATKEDEGKATDLAKKNAFMDAVLPLRKTKDMLVKELKELHQKSQNESDASTSF